MCSSDLAQKAVSGHAPIQVETPARSSGQKHVLQLVTPKLETVRIGIIGLGMRGPGAVERFTKIPGTQIVALCDVLPERVEKTQEILVKAGLPEAAAYSGSEDAWKKLCERKDIDLVYIVTDWKTHAEMGVYAMEHGKHAAIEVPAAMTLEEIWKLIDTFFDGVHLGHKFLLDSVADEARRNDKKSVVVTLVHNPKKFFD